MDRQSGMRSEEVEDREGQLPAKDAPPCYMCAINNLENCTHLDAVSRNVNSNAVSMNNTPVPIHHGGRDIPPSYSATCPELVRPGHVTFAMGDPQVAMQNSEVLEDSATRKKKIDGLDQRCTSGCSQVLLEELVSMYRPSEMRSAEAGEQAGQLPAKDALPCYMCAINNLENCTHLDGVSRDVNSNAVPLNNTPVPVHHGGRHTPPSYSVTRPELVLPDYAAFTIDPPVTTQDPEVPGRNDATGGNFCGKLVYTLILIVIAVIAFWVIFFRR